MSDTAIAFASSKTTIARFASWVLTISSAIKNCRIIAKSLSFLRMERMAIREDLEGWIVTAITHHGGKASVTAISKYVWENYESSIRTRGNALYTWQYDLRWAGQNLQKKGKLLKHRSGWELTL